MCVMDCGVLDGGHETSSVVDIKITRRGEMWI